MTHFQQIIRNGKVVTSEAVHTVDLAISDGRIASWLPAGHSSSADREVDARGFFLLPGLFDMHTHFRLNIGGGRYSEDFPAGTRAAIRGGVTTVVDFFDPIEDDLNRGLEARLDEADGRSWCDFALHAVLMNAPRTHLQIPQMVSRGISTYKVFTTYADRGLKSQGPDLKQVLAMASTVGARVLVHAEDDDIVQRSTRAVVERGDTSIRRLPDARPTSAEVGAIRKTIEQVRHTGGPTHIVHISTQAGAALVREARAEGLPVTGETGPHYLTTNRSVYQRPEGHRYSACPPFRQESDRLALWEAVADGSLSVVATDTCGFPAPWKDECATDFRRLPFGLASIEVLLPVLVTMGVQRGRLDWPTLVARASESPARLSGLFPHKGTLAQGADADIVWVRPDTPAPFDVNDSQGSLDYSLFDGMPLTGFPSKVQKGGQLLWEDGWRAEEPPQGRFLTTRFDAFRWAHP